MYALRLLLVLVLLHRLPLLVFADILAVLFARCQHGPVDCSGQRRTSIASSRLQWAAPDLNSGLQMAVGSAGPQPGAPGADWATPEFNRGGSGAEWAAPDLSSQKMFQKIYQKRMSERMSEEMSEDMSIEMSDKMSEKNVRKNVRRYVRRNVRRNVERYVRRNIR